MSKAVVLLWHRKLALIAGVAILLWGASGLLHPLMTWTNPRAVTFVPPPVAAVDLSSAADIREILKAHEIERVSGLRVIGSVLQVKTPDSPGRLYINMTDGSIIEGGDRERAIMIARHYTGLNDVAVKQAQLITEFSHEYPYINRYLPVWRVDFNDLRDLSVYVDTATDRLGTINDPKKVILQSLFQIFHTGRWMEGAEALRLAVLSGLVLSILAITAAGIYMLVFLRGKRKGLRKAHRVIAYAALWPLLMFPISGLFHLFVHSPVVYQAPDDAALSVAVNDLEALPVTSADDMQLVLFDDKVWWRVHTGEDVSYHTVGTKAVLAGEEAFVRGLFEKKPESVTKLDRFSDEYGFANKRLPVWRVETEEDLVFVEASTAVIAARVSPLKVAETWGFTRLHKWQFLDGLSERVMGAGPLKNALRDAVMVFFVGLALVLSVLGLFLRPRR